MPYAKPRQSGSDIQKRKRPMSAICMFSNAQKRLLDFIGSGSVILFRPKMGLPSPKRDVISMPRQQYTNTKHVSIEWYHPVVSIMLS